MATTDNPAVQLLALVDAALDAVDTRHEVQATVIPTLVRTAVSGVAYETTRGYRLTHAVVAPGWREMFAVADLLSAITEELHALIIASPIIEPGSGDAPWALVSTLDTDIEVDVSDDNAGYVLRAVTDAELTRPARV